MSASAVSDEGRNRFDGVHRVAFRAYATAVSVAGLAVLVWCASTLRPSDLTSPSASFWLICVLLLVGELRPLVGGGVKDANGLSVTPALVFAVLLGHGTVAAVLLQAAATALVDTGRRKALWRIVFNASQFSVSWWACGGVMTLLGHAPTLTDPLPVDERTLLLAVPAALVMFAMNQALIGGVFALKTGEPFRELLVEDIAYEALTSFALLGLAPVVALAMEHGVAFVPLLLPSFIAVYQVAGIATQRETQALTDQLTGLANRHALREQAAVALQDGEPAALLLFDLDRFKDVNDTLGHHVGDALLVVVARRLEAAVRPGDTVARLGGDEFAVLMPGSGDADEARETAQRLHQVLSEAVELEGLLVDVGASIGLAVAPQDGTDLDGLLQRADVAMYAAKESGSVESYDAARDHNSTARLVLVGELRRALDQGELDVHYQPKACLATGRVVGVEALVRWEHPERGAVGPDVFVPLAERSGLVQLLTRHVLDAAVAQAAAWRAQGLDLTVAVNVSVKDLCGDVLPDEVASVLARHGLPASCLVLEVTEGMLFADPARATATLERLHQAGVALSLDDFGTGWSSLGHLRDLPVQEVKIDRSFVQRMGDDPRDLAIVRSVLDLARGLGLRVVAEGVEDEATWHTLQELGCDTAQGWYLSRAEPAEALAGLLADRAFPLHRAENALLELRVPAARRP